jgi:hypothetical protein
MKDFYTCMGCKQQFYLTWYVEAGGVKFCSHKCHITYALRHPKPDEEDDPLPKGHDGCFGD